MGGRDEKWAEVAGDESTLEVDFPGILGDDAWSVRRAGAMTKEARSSFPRHRSQFPGLATGRVLIAIFTLSKARYPYRFRSDQRITDTALLVSKPRALVTLARQPPSSLEGYHVLAGLSHDNHEDLQGREAGCSGRFVTIYTTKASSKRCLDCAGEYQRYRVGRNT